MSPIMPRPRIVIGEPYRRPDRGNRFYFNLFGNPTALIPEGQNVATDLPEEAQDIWFNRYWIPYKNGKIRDPQKPAKMLSDSVSDFLKQKQALKKPRTFKGYKQRLNQFLRFFSDKKITDKEKIKKNHIKWECYKPWNELTKDDLINYKIHLKQRNQKDKSINAQIRHINAFLNSLDWKENKVPHKNNPEWKTSKYIQRKIEMPTKEEKEIWLSWGPHIPEFKDIMPLELFCGISANDFMFPILFEENRIILSRMKTNTDMYIPFFPDLKKHVPHLVGRGWVLLWKYGIDNFVHKHQKIREGIGLDRMTPHYFKHVFVSVLYETPRITLKHISEFTGTTIECLEKVYIHTTEKTKIDLMNAVSERLGA